MTFLPLLLLLILILGPFRAAYSLLAEKQKAALSVTADIQEEREEGRG